MNLPLEKSNLPFCSTSLTVTVLVRLDTVLPQTTGALLSPGNPSTPVWLSFIPPAHPPAELGSTSTHIQSLTLALARICASQMHEYPTSNSIIKSIFHKSFNASVRDSMFLLEDSVFILMLFKEKLQMVTFKHTVIYFYFKTKASLKDSGTNSCFISKHFHPSWMIAVLGWSHTRSEFRRRLHRPHSFSMRGDFFCTRKAFLDSWQCKASNQGPAFTKQDYGVGCWISTQSKTQNRHKTGTWTEVKRGLLGFILLCAIIQQTHKCCFVK